MKTPAPIRKNSNKEGSAAFKKSQKPHKNTVKKQTPAVKAAPSLQQATDLHPRNPHHGKYNLAELCTLLPALKPHITTNPKGQASITFSDPAAVKALNSALLMKFYNIQYWQIPSQYLCPAIPGRADYIHYLGDLLAATKNNSFKPCAQDILSVPFTKKAKIPQGNTIKALDIGTGANCVYPIIGTHTFHWTFVGSDCDPTALQSAQTITKKNQLGNRLSLRRQSTAKNVFKGIINEGELFDVTLCNPPFHASLNDALVGNAKKQSNLHKNRQQRTHTKTPPATPTSSLNFSGQGSELWCPGGELEFIKTMVDESTMYAQQVCWFTCLISQKDNLKPLKAHLHHKKVTNIAIMNMAQGQKRSRILAWTFLSPQQQTAWAQQRW